MAVRSGGGRVGIYAALCTENKPDSSRLLLEGESVGSSAMTLTLPSEIAALLKAHSLVTITTATTGLGPGLRKTAFSQVP